MNPPLQRTDRSAWRRRALRGVAALAIVTLLLAVGLTALFLTRPAREAALARGFRQLRESIAGDILIDDIAWPAPLHLRLSGLRWTLRGERLLELDSAELRIDGRALLARDLELTLLRVEARYADLPRMRTALADPSSPAESKAQTRESIPYFRDGAIRGLPSMAILQLGVRADSIAIAADRWISTLHVEGSGDLLRGKQPVASLAMSARLTELGEMRLEVEQRGEDRITGSIQLGSMRDPLLVFGAQPTQEGDAFIGLALDGTFSIPGTVELSTLPLFAAALDGAPALAGIEGEVALSFLGESRAATMTLTARANSWLSAFEARLSSQDGVLSVEHSKLDLAGASATLRGAVHPRIDAQIEIVASSLDWIATVAASVAAPEDLSAHLCFAALGSPANLELAGTLDAFAWNHGVATSIDAAVRGNRVEARVAPIVVRVGRGALAGRTPKQPNLVFDRASAELGLSRLQFVGDYGEFVGSGSYSPTAQGEVDVSWSLRELPPGIVRMLAWPDSTTRSVRAAWPAGERVGMRASGRISRRDAVELDLRVDAILPGPASFESLLPEAIRIDDLGILRMTVDLFAKRGAVGSAFTATADLSSTAWLDSTFIRAEGAGDSLRVQSEGTLFRVLSWDARAEVVQDIVTGTARWALQGPGLAERLSRQPTQEFSLGLDGELELSGPLDAPRVQLDWRGSFSDATFTIASLRGSATRSPESLSAHIDFPQGITTPRVHVDIVEADVEVPQTEQGSGPIEYRLRATSSEFDLAHSGVLTRGDAWSASSDEFRLQVRGRDLVNRVPIVISGTVDPREFNVERLELAGSLGTISASGNLSREGGDLSMSADLQLPEMPTDFRLPPSVWPQNLLFDVDASGPRSFDAHLKIGGVVLGDELPMTLEGAASLSDSLRVRLDVANEQQTLARAAGRLPFDWNAFSAGGDPLKGDFTFELKTTALPVPALWLESSDPRLIRVDGELNAAGSMAKPTATAEVEISFPGWPRVSQWSLWLDAGLVDVGGDSLAVVGTPASLLPELRGRWALKRADERLLSGEASVPLQLRPRLAPDLERDVYLRTESATLPLRDLDDLLPADIGMDGSVGLLFTAAGKFDDPALSGRIDLKNTTSSLPDGSQIKANGSIEIGGTARLPELTGTITVQQGVLIIHNPPPDLLPTEGMSLLWDANAVIDSMGTGLPPIEEGIRLESVRAKLDVTIDIPGGLWVRGKGLEMELAGNLRMLQAPADSLPAITGELEALRGELIVLGHNFGLNHGQVSFFGNALTPQLDARLGTRVSDVDVRVIITGTPLRPELRFESTPEMSEADITSLLLFGRPLAELDDDQMGLVGARTNDLARSFGIAAVQNELRERIGVDLLQIDTGGSGSVLVGKYLRPNVLLKYEQMLQETTAFLVNLEYMLSRRVRLETTYGRRRQSGVEINWTKDY
jgi:hypothetical protein